MRLELRAVLHGYSDNAVFWNVDISERGTYAVIPYEPRTHMLISSNAIYETLIEHGVDAARAAAVERIERLRLDWSWLGDPDGVPDCDDDDDEDLD